MEEAEAEEQAQTWISWFLEQPGHQWMCEVQTSFIEDSFNLYGLRNEITYDFRQCLDTILGDAPADEDRHKRTSAYVWSKRLYGLIHARFILTAAGVNLMLEMYEAVTFGRCPRYLCHGAPVLPVGLQGDLGLETVKLFCPRCEDIYAPTRLATSSEQRLEGRVQGSWCTDEGFEERQLPGEPITDADRDKEREKEKERGKGKVAGEGAGSAAAATRSSSQRAASAVAGAGASSAGAAAAAASASASAPLSVAVSGVGMKRARSSGAGFFETSAAAGAGAAGDAPSKDAAASRSSSSRSGGDRWPASSPFSNAAVAFPTSPAQLDGAYFGPSFPHVLLISKPSLLHPKSLEAYVPRVYGFRVHGLRGRTPLALGDAKGSYAAASVGREGVWQVGAGVAAAGSSAGAAGAGAGAGSGAGQWKARGASRLSSAVRDDGSLEGSAAAAAAGGSAGAGTRASASKGRAKGKRGSGAARSPSPPPAVADTAAAAGSSSSSGAAVRQVVPAASPAAAGGARHVPPTFRRPDEPDSLGKNASMPHYLVLTALPHAKPRAERDPALTIPYPAGGRPVEDDFADSDDEGGGGAGGGGGEKKARRT